MREEKLREKRELQASLFNLRSSVGQISSGQGLKFIALTRAMSGYKKVGVSPKIQRKSFQEIKDFRLGRLPTHAIMLKEVRILLTLDYSSLLGRKM